MMNLKKWVLFFALLGCFSLNAARVTGTLKASVEPDDGVLNVEFLEQNGADAEFLIEASDLKTAIEARWHMIHDDDKKITFKKYVGGLFYNGTEYTFAFMQSIEYEPERYKSDTQMKYRRMDDTIFIEADRGVLPIMLNAEECQQAFVQGKLEDYFADKNMRFVPMMPTPRRGQLARRFEKEGDISSDMPIMASRSGISSGSSDAIDALQIIYQKQWTTYVPVEKPIILEWCDHSRKKYHGKWMWAFSIEGQQYVFCDGYEMAYERAGYVHTTEPTEEENVFYDVSTPQYNVYQGRIEVIPAEASRVKNERTSHVETPEWGKLCIGHTIPMMRGKSAEHTLVSCEKVSTCSEGVRTLADGAKVPYREHKEFYKVTGTREKSTKCGTWELNKRYGTQVPHEGVLPDSLNSHIYRAEDF